MSWNGMPRRLLLAVTLASAAACALPAVAHARITPSLVELDVVDRDSGQTLPEYRHRAQDWIAGAPGHRYAVRLRNTTGERVLVVLSVDGVNAVTGQNASPAQAGYVLEPWESAEISGWRKSMDDIAQFVFTDLGDSYAARTGRPRNVGVIGVAVFQESRPRYYPAPMPPMAREGEYRRDAAKAASAPGAAASGMAREQAADSATRQSMGTGHGQREWSPVGQTRFARATRSPAQISELRYDDSERLMAMGVIRRDYDYPRYGRRNGQPRAFPNGFVADPPYR